MPHSDLLSHPANREPGLEILRERPGTKSSITGRKTAGWVLVFLGGLLIGAWIDRGLMERPPRTIESGLPESATLLKPGPWGKLAQIPLTIAPPEELLPVRSVEAAGTRWFFGGMTVEDLKRLLESAGIMPDERDVLLAPETLHEETRGVEVMPSDEVLLSLAPSARTEIYKALARYPENYSQLTFIAKSTVEERFRECGVSQSTMELFHELCCEHGSYLVFSGLACVLSKTPEYEEKIRFMKALTLQRTLLLRVYLNPDTDINALAAYWGRGCWATDVKAIFSSLSRVPGGIWISLLKILPPLPTAQLYTYPVVADNPLNGPLATKDCHWTSFNFFQDQPDPRFSDPEFIRERIKESYSPVVGDPRYGDIIFLARADGSIVHSAVYLADDIVYTKNGSTTIHPWIFATLSDVVEQYSFQAPPGEKLVVSYYRNKSF